MRIVARFQEFELGGDFYVRTANWPRIGAFALVPRLEIRATTIVPCEQDRNLLSPVPSIGLAVVCDDTLKPLRVDDRLPDRRKRQPRKLEVLDPERDADDREEAAGRRNHVADAEPEARQEEPDDVA